MGKKILVFHQGAIGDIILAFSALTRIPDTPSFDIYCQGIFAGLLQKLLLVDHVFPVEHKSTATLFSGKPEPALSKRLGCYDVIILFSSSNVLKQTIRASVSSQVIAIRPRPAPSVRIHITDFLFYQLRHGFTELRAPAVAPPAVFPDASDSTTILIHPGSGSPRKNWPLERFYTVSKDLQANGFRTEWILGPAEHSLYNELTSRGIGSNSVHRLTDLLAVLSLLETARAFIGNDSGLSHLAAFCGIPTVTIFGPSDPVQWHPRGPHARSLSPLYHCDPCFLTKNANCREEYCLHSIVPQLVEQALIQVLDHARPSSPRPPEPADWPATRIL